MPRLLALGGTMDNLWIILLRLGAIITLATLASSWIFVIILVEALK